MIKLLLEDKYFFWMVVFESMLLLGILYLLCFVEESVSKVEVNVNSENAKYLGGIAVFILGGLFRSWLGVEKQ